MFEDEWAFPIVDGKNGDAGLVYGSMALNVEQRHHVDRIIFL